MSSCIVAGCITHMFYSDYPVLPLFFAPGLLFADYYMYRRLNNIDPKTGLFNRGYLQVLISLSKKQQLKGATVIRFQVQRGSEVMISILKAWKPEECKLIAMGDGLFLLVSGPVKDFIVERFISLITEQAKNEGLPVEADYETDREGAMDALLEKYA